MSKQAPLTIKKRRTQVKGTIYTYWRVSCGTLDGKRIYQQFKTEAAAKRFVTRERSKQKLWDQKQNILERKIGQDAKKLSNDHLRQAVEATRILNDTGTSLVDAANFYVHHASPDGGPRTIGQLCEDYLQSRIDAGRRERTIKDIRQRLGRFAKDFQDIPAHQVTTFDLERWLNKRGGNGTTRKNYRVHLVGLFNFGKKRKHVRENPAATLETPSISKTKPYVLPIGDIEKLLNIAQKNKPEMVPYFALCVFAGIRPAECERLDWKDINFERKEIFIDAKKSKTGDERWIEMSDNLIAWLLPHRKLEGRIFFGRASFISVRKKAHIQWKADCMRHSYGSYHLAMYDNAGKTALQMGHREIGTLFEYYRRAVRKEDAENFWNIRPQYKSNIIPIQSKVG